MHSLAVVMPFRHMRLWLPEAIASLAHAGEGLDWQLIAVDDGSADDSAKLLQQLTAHWPEGRLLLLEGGGGGVSRARNLAIAAASAPLIAFLDADDRALPQRLQAPLALLQARPELSHVHGGWWRMQADGTPITLVEPWREGAGFERHAALTHKAVLPSAWTVRREVLLELGGFDPALSHAEDVDLLLRLAAAGHQGAWLEQPLVRYRVHQRAASHNIAALSEALQAVVDRHLSDQPQPWADHVRYGTASWCAWKAWAAGDPALALEQLQRALTVCRLPPVRRPVHLLEHFARSCARDGVPFALEPFLASGFWQQARQLLLQPT